MDIFFLLGKFETRALRLFVHAITVEMYSLLDPIATDLLPNFTQTGVLAFY